MNLDELTIETINKMWSEDANIDISDLSNELIKIPKLHNKYFTLYIKLGLKIKKLESEYIELKKAKMEYYNGTMDVLELKRRNWAPNPLRILRDDLNKYIESDKDIIEMSLKLAYRRSASDFLNDILKQINNRGYYISDIIKWEKFKSGIN